MTEAQIKHMAEQFLRWRLPADFHPDGGISFEATYQALGGVPMRREPVGTNLLTYTQAKAMIAHMLEGLPEAE